MGSADERWRFVHLLWVGGRTVVHPFPPSPTRAALELLIYSLTSEDVSFYLIEFVLLS